MHKCPVLARVAGSMRSRTSGSERYTTDQSATQTTSVVHTTTTSLLLLLLLLLLLHPFNGPLSGTTRVSRYEKGKTILDLLEQEIVSDSGISWAICKSAPRPGQTTMPALTTQFYTGRMPFLPPNQQRQSTGSFVQHGQRP